ncbi:MAG: amidohydrolase family protein [Ilumatobacteraceae bacterium]
MTFSFPVISADSHITEPPDCYTAHIDPAWRDRAPHMVSDDARGDMFVIPGMSRPIAMGLVAAAGKPAEELTVSGVSFDELHRSGWDPNYRIADQQRDGVAAEVIYPTVGMMICNHPDADFKHAAFTAYNRWIADYCSVAPDRLLGCGQTALRSVDEGVADLQRIADLGLRGVMMPGEPATWSEDGSGAYDDPMWDPFWQAAIDLGLPLSFHILTSRASAFESRPRGPRINGFLAIIRGIQDIMGTLIYGGVFERHPDLKVVCVEADAGWVPHYMYRMDHAWKRHRNWMAPGVELQRLPSEYFAEHIYTTFQDDWTAFRVAEQMNWRRLMWANDFPHSDSTWPWSQEMLVEHTAHLTDEMTQAILSGNVSDLYQINTDVLSAV